MRRALRLHLALWLAFSAGCAHRVSHTAPDESRPHISWDIRTGGDLGDAQVVCASTETTPNCVLDATTEQRRSLVTVHLSLHAAAEQTTYMGSMRVPFIQDAGQSASSEVKGTVQPGSLPVGTTVAGIVTGKPGTYTLSISLAVVQASRPQPQRIVLEVPVVVC